MNTLILKPWNRQEDSQLQKIVRYFLHYLLQQIVLASIRRKTEWQTDPKSSMTDSQTLGLLRVEVVPMAAFRERLSGCWQVGGAHGSRATQETTFGCIGDGDRRPAALLLQHCFSCRNDNCTEIHLLLIVTVSAGNRKPVAFITIKTTQLLLKTKLLKIDFNR